MVEAHDVGVPNAPQAASYQQGIIVMSGAVAWLLRCGDVKYQQNRNDCVGILFVKRVLLMIVAQGSNQVYLSIAGRYWEAD